jgi:hypothetical protein
MTRQICPTTDHGNSETQKSYIAPHLDAAAESSTVYLSGFVFVLGL